MSTKYTGGFITKSPVAPTTSAASGIWTLDQQQQAQKAGTWPSPPLFIEDMFSTYLVTGDGTAPAVNNGIDVSGQGGLVWIKKRSAAGSNSLFDTARGANLRLISNSTAAQDSVNLSFTSTGFSNYTFDSAVTYASWTFKKQAKFFDIVTYAGAGDGTTVSHNLGSTPGCVIVKATNGVDGWFVYHRSLTASATNRYLRLDTTDAQAFLSSWISVSDTTITFPNAYGPTAGTGTTYVAYLFAHDAGGFPVSGGGSTNGITCGTFTTDGTGAAGNITLGYEPQWILLKQSGGVDSWNIIDTMRGSSLTSYKYLQPNASTQESSSTTTQGIYPTATGFFVGTNYPAASATYIYIAIRRGPMKTPTVGTSVFDEDLAGNASAPSFTSAFPVDLGFIFRLAGGDSWYWVDRLRGTPSLNSNNTDAEASFPTLGKFDYMNGYGSSTTLTAYTGWNFRRAPGFFDEVCYTGNGATQTLTHNLGVAPELMVVKKRSVGGTSNWAVYASPLANADAYLFLNDTAAVNTSSLLWNSTAPTSTVFSLGASTNINQSGQTAVAYLFATLAGISKVGSYTGTAGLLTVNCGFTTGARFALIKRTDSTGDWYVYDSVRGITSGNDPYVLMNSQAAEVTGTTYVDTDTTGFKVTAAAPAGLNASGGTYIFLAIA